MKSYTFKRALSILLSLALTLSLMPVSSLAADTNDLDGHWTAAAIETCHSYNIMNGDNRGHYRPDDDITRAEFAAMVNRTFGYDAQNVPDLTDYKDLPKDKWYAKDMQAAIAFGMIHGYGNGVAAPDDKITREQVALILMKVLRLAPESGTTTSFIDIEDVSAWARPAVQTMERSGYVVGDNDQFGPKKYMTRGEAAHLLLDVFGMIADKNLDAKGGEYKNVTIRTSGVTLKNAVITGDLIISEGVGDGDVWLDTVQIEGRLLVVGGGENSIHLKNVTVGKNIVVDKPLVAGEQAVRFSVEQTNNMTILFEGTAREVVVTGGLATIIIDSDGKITSFNTFMPEDKKANPAVFVSENAIVGRIIATVPSKIGGNGSVGHIEADADGIVIDDTLRVNPSDVTVGGGLDVIVDNSGHVIGTVNADPAPSPAPPATSEPSTSVPESSPAPTPVPTPVPTPEPSVLGGTASITGTNKIGQTVTVNTNLVTGGNGAFGYQWKADNTDISDANSASYTIQGADAGKTITCTVTRSDVSGSVTATLTGVVPYTIAISMIDNEAGDTVTVTPDAGITAANVTIQYTLSNVKNINLLSFSGVSAAIADVTSAGNGTRTYKVTAGDATDGVITIIAAFEHTNLAVDPITFTNTNGHIVVTYGDGTFENAIITGHQGTGAISYSSSNPSVATVNSSGVVAILKEGSTVITAHKAADAVYAQASASYTLAINRKTITISGVTAQNKAYDGNTTATVSGTPAINGLVSGDTVTVNAGSASFANPHAGTNKSVTFSGFSLGGADAGNYTLSAQPAAVTADITPKAVSVASAVHTKVYDGSTAANGVSLTFSGILAADAGGVSVGAVTAAYPSANAGTTTLNITAVVLSGTSASDYTVTVPANNMAVAGITAKAITVTPDGGKSKKYGAADPVLTYTSSAALAAGDSFTGALSRAAGENVGSYAITLGTLSAGGNYALTLGGGVTFAITKADPPTGNPHVIHEVAYVAKNHPFELSSLLPNVAPLTLGNVTYSPVITTNGGVLAALTYTSGDTLILPVQAVAPNLTSVVTVTISSDNYKDFTVLITITTVDKDDVSAHISFTSGSAVYTGAEISHENATAGGFTPGANPVWTYEYVAEGSGASLGANHKPLTAGDYTVNVTYEDDDNLGYASVTFMVDKKELTVNVTVNNKAYDGTSNAAIASATLMGAVTGDDVSLVTPYPTASFADSAVGNSKTVSFGGNFAVTGNDAGNYTLTQPSNVKANITAGFTPVKDTHYTATALNAAGWTDVDYTVTAKTGYQLSLTNTTGGSWTGSLSYSAETDSGSVTFYVRNTSSGEISVSKTESYKLDKTAPTGTVNIKNRAFASFINTISFGLFFKDTVSVTISGADAAPGVVSTVEYLLSDTVFESSQNWGSLTWTTGNSTNLTKDWKGYVYARITDAAGNFTVIRSDGVVVYGDAVAVTPSIAHTKYSGTKTTDVTLNGNTIANVNDGTSDLTPATHYTVAISENTATITLSAAYLDSLTAGSYTLTIRYNPLGVSYTAHTDNDEPAVTTIALTVSKAAGAAVTQPAVSGQPTLASITVGAVTLQAATGQSIEYNVSLASNGTGFLLSTWQSSTTFAGLSANKTYYVYARSASDGNYNAGTAQVSAGIMTAAPVIPEPDPRTVAIDFESDATGKTYSVTEGNSKPAAVVVENPAVGGQKSLQFTSAGASGQRYNQASVIPIRLPYELQNYKSVSFRIYWLSGSADGNVAVYAADSTSKFIKYGFGNESGAQYNFSKNLVGRTGLATFDSASYGGKWTDFTINIGTLDTSIQSLVNDIYIAIGINADATVSYLLDDIIFTLKDDFILPNEGETVDAPTLAAKTARNISINAVAAPGNGQEVEYGISTSMSIPASWQSGLTFSGLTENTTYYIFARSKANATHRAGTPGVLEVTTDAEQAPVPVTQGAAETGDYRNLFMELGKSEADVNAKVMAAWQQLFYGNDTQRIFYPVADEMAYIYTADTDDVRSEGMSYGMMICVQMNKQEEFNKLWKWAKTYMYNASGDLRGYFAWQCGTSGNKKDSAPAPDGEFYFATALLFAANRWGSTPGGIFDYAKEARVILYDIINRKGSEKQPLFDQTYKMPIFSPMHSAAQSHTDHSYHLPAFFEIWAEEIEYGEEYWDSIWGSETAALKDAAFYREAAQVSREFLMTTTNQTTGLGPDYATFTGTPTGSQQEFRYDAWRIAMNSAVDYAWWARDTRQITYADRIQAFFSGASQNPNGRTVWGSFSYPSLWQLNGSAPYNNNKDHSPGLVACNAVASLAASNMVAWEFVEDFWNTSTTTGTYRYYDGCLYMMGLLHVSGNFQAYYSTGPTGSGIKSSRISPTAAYFDLAKPADVNIAITWNDNTLVSIANGQTALTEANYTITGNTVKIHKEYLSTQTVGATYLTFTFSQGSERTLRISVDNTAILVLGRTFEQAVSVEYTPGGGAIEASFVEDAMRITKTGSYSWNGVIVTLRLGDTTLVDSAYQNLYLRIKGVSGDFTGSKNFRAEVLGSGKDSFGTLGTGNTLLARQTGNPLVATTWKTLVIPLEAARPSYTGDVKIAFGLENIAAAVYDIGYVGLVPEEEAAVPSSSITPTSADFDKANPTDIGVTMNLNGNTLASIKNGGATLSSGTDYIVSGNAVMLKKEYFAALSLGAASLTFVFNAGASRTLSINVMASNASINPASAAFDKANPADIPVAMTLNGNTLTAVSNGIAVLTKNMDYTISGDTVTLHSSYLSGLSRGTASISFVFTPGATQTLTVNVTDSSIQNAAISPTSASFDKYAPADIDVTMTLNGNTLETVKNGSATLTEGTHYTVSGSVVTLKSSYLATLSLGTTMLIFGFAPGEDQTLSLDIADSTPPTSVIRTRYDFSEGLDWANIVTYSTGANAATIATVTTNPTYGNVLDVVAAVQNDAFILPFNIGTKKLSDYTAIEIVAAAINSNATNKYTYAVEASTTGTLNKIGGTGNIRIAVTNSTTAILKGQNTWITSTITLTPGAAADLTGEFNLAFGIGEYHSSANYQISSIRLIGADSSIGTTSATFNLDEPEDIPVSVTWNGNLLDSIKNGQTTLAPGTDYIVNGGTVTLTKEYLATLGLGNYTLVFVFNEGASRNLTVAVIDNSAPPVPQTKLSYTFEPEEPLEHRIGGSATAAKQATGVSSEANVLRVSQTNGRSVVALKFNLGSTTLADYASIRIRLAGVNTSYKPLLLETSASGTFGTCGSNVAIIAQYGNAIGGTGSWSNLTLPITLNASTAAQYTGEVWIGVGFNDGTASFQYDISTIELIPKVSGTSILRLDFNDDNGDGTEDTSIEDSPDNDPRKEPDAIQVSEDDDETDDPDDGNDADSPDDDGGSAMSITPLEAIQMLNNLLAVCHAVHNDNF